MTRSDNRAAFLPGSVASAPRTNSSSLSSPTAWAAFVAGCLTSFTVSVGGEMPVGEIILALMAGWAILCALFNQTWPCELFRTKILWALMAAQGVSLCGYIFSDLYRQSSPHDMIRGWGRMVFLGINIIGITYLFGRSSKNLTFLVAGQCISAVASALILGPLFGDMWKFGVGAPLTFFAVWLAPKAGPLIGACAAAGLGVTHFILGYRSMGVICLIVSMLTLLQSWGRGQARLWLAPLGLAAALFSVFWIYGNVKESEGGRNTNRSDVERSSMATAALEAVEKSPFIGYGSWFSNTDVYSNFTLIRRIAAREAKVGGFPRDFEEPGTTALHSQILVSIAEGGLFGGTFFILFGIGLLVTTCRIVFWDGWHPSAPFVVTLLLSAIWNLFFSPFSGAQRIYIAMACGIMFLYNTGVLFSKQEEQVIHESDL